MSDHQRLRALFHEAADLDRGDWPAFLDEHCKDDAELRDDLLDLLERATDDEEVETLAVPIARGLQQEIWGDAQPTDIGPYKIIRALGEGGFGVVYLAQQTEPVKRQVAIKVIKPGMDSAAVIKRFEAERQALAIMDHPNVAVVHDAGSTERGLPYFVMEHVAGVPITDYCDTHRLTTRGRLELFTQVCAAVQHAHTKGIIHRDIKPSNVLVQVKDEDEPVVKVIDFGIAKAVHQKLTEHSVFTAQGQLIGTPEYMSPEQAEMSGLDIDTRSDVYSLGVLLYELLVGASPFESKRLREAALFEIHRIIREEEPPKPSTRLSSLGASANEIATRRQTRVEELARMLKAELEWIPLLAMRKDRTERYQSARDLADDIRNYLDGRPLHAGPESPTYRARKFIRRHKTGVGIAAVVTLVVTGLLVGLTITTVKMIDALDDSRKATIAATNSANEATTAKGVALDRLEQLTETRKRERWQLYVASFNAATLSAEVDPRAVPGRLEDCPPEYRGWEWDALKAASDRSLVVLEGHGEYIFAADFHPDGKRLLTGSIDGNIVVWDLETNEPLLEGPGHDYGVRAAYFTHDGERILSCGHDGLACVWDANTGERLVACSGHTHSVSFARYNEDRTRILTISLDGTAMLWDAADGTPLARITGAINLCSATFAPDGHILVGSIYGDLSLWSPDGQTEVRKFVGHNGTINSARFNGDGTRLLTSSFDHSVRVWNVADATELLVIEADEGEPFMYATYNADATRILTGNGDFTARIWNAETGEQLVEMAGHTLPVHVVMFNPDESRVLTASSDGSARIWDAETGDEIVALTGHQSGIATAAYSPDGTRILTASMDYTARLWDADTKPESIALHGHKHAVEGLAYSTDGRTLLTWSRDGTARTWDAITGDALRTFAGHDAAIKFAAFSNDGRILATASDDATAKLWDVETGDVLVSLEGHTELLYHVSMNADASRIATASGDGTAGVWDREGNRLLTLTGHDAEVNAATFTADGEHVVTTGRDGTVRTWDATTGEPQFVMRGHEASARQVALSPDGRRAVTASNDDTARLWNLETGELVATLAGHQAQTLSVAFSPDGTLIATSSFDETARIWSAEDGSPVHVLTGHFGGTVNARFSPDGKRLVVASVGGVARLWDVATGTFVHKVGGHSDIVFDAMFSPDGKTIATVSTDTTARLHHATSYRERAGM